MHIDLLPLVEALEKVKLQCTRVLNNGAEPICGNCGHWVPPESTGRLANHGFCANLTAQAKTFNSLNTRPDFGCIYHEPKE